MKIILPTGLPFTRTKRGAELVKVIPDEIPESRLTEINGEFENYIFEERFKSDIRSYLCTNCYFSFSNHARTITSEMDDVFTARHNEYVTCPRCGKTLQKKLVSKCREMLNLNQTMQFLIFYPESHDRVWGFRVFADKLFEHGGWRERRICVYLRAVYCWEPGGAVCFMARWDWNSVLRFEETASPCAVVSTDSVVRVIGARELEGTFLKYSQLGLIRETVNAQSIYGNDAVKWLAEYCVHPQIEFLAKAGYRQFISDTLLSGRRGGGLVNWNAKAPWEFFRMQKSDFREFSKHTITLDRLQLYSLSKKYFPGLTVHRFQSSLDENRLNDLYISENLEQLYRVMSERGISFERCMNYFGRQKALYNKQYSSMMSLQMLIRDYRDYISDCVSLGLDLDFLPILMPADLSEEHTATSKRVKIYKNAHLKEAFEKRREKLERIYHFDNGRIMVRVPRSIEEIIDEGKALNHCVGSYAERHALGKTTILFVRSCAEPDKPLYTMELAADDPWKLLQIRAFRNGAPDIDTYTEIKEWLERKGKPKKKEKTA